MRASAWAFALWLSGSAYASLFERGDCTAVQVQSGDTCSSLAQGCGISLSTFEGYNGGASACNTLQPGQHVCCTAGSLPDYRPQPYANGSCKAYTAVQGDNCSKLGAPLGLSIDDINSMNNETWGWDGCINLEVDQTFCLSLGNPPMPAQQEDAVCGPQVVGTQQPSDMSTLASLNPCPLNACCNKWGQCGTTGDFCTISKSATGNPGTSAPGQNGCISNCGMDIIQGSGGQGRQVGYFEAFNTARPCLNMDAMQLPGLGYDTVHFGFGELTSDFQPNMTGNQDQWTTFLQQTGFKKVVSFGGWAFSTDPSTYNIFREAVTPANRVTFATNIANFITSNGLDGVDFDWEYPGAPDIPGIPPGNKDDGQNYLMFLMILRNKLGSGHSISIAAPASYWYLKQFPIEAISKVVDYIVFMTYDLHGQWDYGNKYADLGCPEGGCLRSHVNISDTLNALSMITKAGVNSGQIVVGVGSYGRSFEMVDPSCTGPSCHFTGPNSGATPGRCTQTAGYISNAEISEIVGTDGASLTYDADSDSNILTYGKNWVGYMDKDIMLKRQNLYKGLNMAGSVEWAIDLANWWPPVYTINGKKVVGDEVQTGADLTSNATCINLEQWGPNRQITNATLTAAMWQQANTNQYWIQWANQNKGTKYFWAAFMDQLGLTESYEACHVTDICAPPTCQDIQNPNGGTTPGEDLPGTGHQYMVAISQYNLLNFFHLIYQAVDQAQENWNTLQSAWVTQFDPSVIGTSLLGVKEGLNAAATAIGVIAAILTFPTFGISDAVGAGIGTGAALAGGIVGGVANSLTAETDETFSNLADYANYMDKQFTTIKSSLSDAYSALQSGGSWESLDTRTMFLNGDWVDNTQIGVLNANVNQLNDVMQNHINAIALNWAWVHQRVWIMSYPMTQDEYDNTQWYAGDGDFRLRHYYKGRGHFFQSVFPQTNSFDRSYTDPRNQNPPAWGNLTAFGLSLPAIFESSADSFDLYGFNSTISNYTGFFTNPDFDPSKDSLSLPGVFNIPVCKLDSTYGWTPTLDDFQQALTGPGAIYDDNDNGSYAPFCYCLRIGDGHGTWFDSWVDVGAWWGGGHGFCPDSFNTVGGGAYPGNSNS